MNPEVLTREVVFVPVVFGLFLIFLFAVAWLITSARGRRRRAQERAARPDLLPVRQRALDHAVAVVSFAVGNCSYFETRGWPHEELRKLTERLRELGMLEVDTVRDWLDFASEAAAAEAARAAKPRVRKVATGADYEPGRARFEQEFQTGVDTYKRGGLPALLAARERKKETPTE